jgi:hypothetical protein
MGLTLKLLGLGQITTTTQVDLTSTTQVAKALVVKNIILTNVGSSEASLEIYVRRNAQTPTGQIAPKPTIIQAGEQVILDREITLNLNSANVEIISGKLTTGTGTVDFVVNGLERDV